MSWNTETLENAVAAAPIDPATKRPTLRGKDSRGEIVTVWLAAFNMGFEVLRRGTINCLTTHNAVYYLTAFGFVPDGEVAK